MSSDTDSSLVSSDQFEFFSKVGLGGVMSGVLAVMVASFYFSGPSLASSKTFAFFALLFGIGLLGASGSILAGDGFNMMQEHLDTSSDWDPEKSVKAMSILIIYGFAAMIGTVVGKPIAEIIV